MNDQIDYWSKMSEHGPLASVIDPNDKKGHKNSYISRIRNQAVAAHLPTGPNRLLDFGCGSGNLSKAIASDSCRIVGVDITRRLLTLAPLQSDPQYSIFLQYDGIRLPCKDQMFTVATTYLVLIHITDDERLRKNLRDIHRVLKDGGVLISIEQTNRDTRMTQNNLKKQRNVEDLSAIFTSCGFTVEKVDHLRQGRFPFLYLMKFGILPISWLSILGKIDRFLARHFNKPKISYVDTLFLCRKKSLE